MRPALQRLFVIVAMFIGFAAHRASADDPRADARAHYQAGVKAYTGADYRAAIKEFTAAQQLAPADLNNYNLALCYDKLGEAEPAIQFYRTYLDKVPSTDKRGEIEASVARLDAAVKSAVAKKAAEAKAAEDAKAAESQRKADDMKKAEAEVYAAEEARKAEEVRKADEEAKRHPVAVAPAGGSTGTVGTGVAVTTGDAQLDRAQSININAIRDQRIGGAGSGIPDTRGGPTAMGAVGRPLPPAGQGNLNASATPPAPLGAAAQAQPNGAQPVDQPKHADPIYKKWWFWAIVAVSAYVVYEVATSGPSNNNTRVVREAPLHGVTQATRPGGLTLFSW
jgi:hypothetical protein